MDETWKESAALPHVRYITCSESLSESVFPKRFLRRARFVDVYTAFFSHGFSWYLSNLFADCFLLGSAFVKDPHLTERGLRQAKDLAG